MTTTTFGSTSLPDVERQPSGLPLLRADVVGEAARWAAQHKDALRAFVAHHGALLVRGLGLGELRHVEAVFRQLGNLMIETEAFAPRRCYAEGVYSSSKWPPNQQMCMHHELSYALEPPGQMLFACLTAPGDNGATPVADATAVLEALPAELVERFERLGWLLIRNYNDDIRASVPGAFGTAHRRAAETPCRHDDIPYALQTARSPGPQRHRRAVETSCRDHDSTYAWQPDGSLRTWQRRGAVVRHPVTGRRCWFNQIAFLNEWTIAPEIREYLVEVYGEDGLPFNTRFGNGDPIEADVVHAINAVYEANTVREPWQAGDLLLVDNVAAAHAREPFEGPREIVVALADPVHPAK